MTLLYYTLFISCFFNDSIEKSKIMPIYKYISPDSRDGHTSPGSPLIRHSVRDYAAVRLSYRWSRSRKAVKGKRKQAINFQLGQRKYYCPIEIAAVQSVCAEHTEITVTEETVRIWNGKYEHHGASLNVFFFFLITLWLH